MTFVFAAVGIIAVLLVIAGTIHGVRCALRNRNAKK
jgi:hypothetical protein